MQRKTRKSQIVTPEKNLYLIPLDQPMEGFHSFINAWVYQSRHTVLVDVGPSSTIPMLLDALTRLDIKRIDAVLLTHIHIDHAGGIGEIAEQFPDIPVVCHPSAIPHLCDPSRLWAGSRKTLGAIAETYGPIRSVPEERLVSSEVFNDFGVTPIATPGHAPHHVSYHMENILFGGETCGVMMELQDTVYLRPATPYRFFMETCLESLEKLTSVPYEIYCFGHFGSTRNAQELIKKHREQIRFWAEIIQHSMKDENPLQSSMENLLSKDPLLAPFQNIDSDIQKRERYFLENSIRGFLGYLDQ